MKKITLMRAVIVIAPLALLVSSCTKLNESPYSSDTVDTYFKSPEEVTAAWLQPYAFMQTHIYQTHFALQEFTTDEAVAPTRGGYVDQNGAWERFHRHTWTSLEPWIQNEWTAMFQGIGYANYFINSVKDLDLSGQTLPVSKEQMVAEAKMVRDLHYYWALSDFGNIPIVDSIGEINPPTKSAKEVFQWLESDIKANIPLLSEKGDPNWYGHFTQTAAHTLLAKLYLNAKVFTGEDRADDCIAECDAVINSGKYTLDAAWNDPFLIENENSNENIFVVPFDNSQAPQFNGTQQQLHWDLAGKYNLNYADGCWFKTVTDGTFYSKFQPNDHRINQWLAGPQTYTDEDGNEQPVMDDDGNQLTLNPDIQALNNPDGGWYDGVVNIKYEIQEGGLENMNNDIVVFRLADVMFMKAESLMRKNGGSADADALQLINDVRARSFDSGDPDAAFSSLDMNGLLDERAREFAYEMTRREDLIRFGKFNDAWWEKDATDAKYEIFPIPANIRTANPALEQNPGY